MDMNTNGRPSYKAIRSVAPTPLPEHTAANIQTSLYQAEVARRFKDGIPADEQPSLLSQAVYKPLTETVTSARYTAGTAFVQREIDAALLAIEAINEDVLGNLIEAMRGSVVNSEPNPPANPPALSEFLFSLLGPKDRVDSMLGDLEEFFRIDLETVSEARARWRYRGRVWRSLGPLIFNKMKNWGFFAFILEIGRRKIGW
jgi:hypothetical protein